MKKILMTAAALCALGLPAFAAGTPSISCRKFNAMDHSGQMAAVNMAMGGDKMASDHMKSGKMASDKMASDHMKSDKMASGAMAADHMSKGAMKAHEMQMKSAMEQVMAKCKDDPSASLVIEMPAMH